MQQVLRTMTSAASGSSVGSMPSATRSPARRSESCSFIWHPKVRTWNRRGMGARVYGPGLSGSPGVHVGLVAFLVAATAVSIGSVVQGAVGFGLNLLAAPFVALVIPEALPATMVLVAFPLAVSTVVRERHAVEWPALRWMLLGAVPGTLLGLAIVGEVDSYQLAVGDGPVTRVGVSICVVSPPIPVTAGSSVAAGVFSNGFGTASSVGGPPGARLVQHRQGPGARSTP